MRNRWNALAVCFALFGVVLVGCSSQDSTGTKPTTSTNSISTTTKAQALRVAIEQTSIRANGLTFNARSAGPKDGELVLLLHGFPQTSYEWRSQLLVLGKAGFYAVAPDQRGYSPGARPTNDSQYTIDHMVDDTIAIADELGAKRFHLVGHDWGAGVAWATAIAHSERIASMAVLSVPHPAAYAKASSDEQGEQRSKQGYIGVFTAPGAAVSLGADLDGFLRIAFGGAASDADIAEYASVLGEPGALDAALAWYRANDLRGGLSEAATAVSVPTLFVFRTQDCCLGRDAADLTKDYVTGPFQYEILEGVSHWIPEEATGPVNKLLVEHLAKYRQNPNRS